MKDLNQRSDIFLKSRFSKTEAERGRLEETINIYSEITVHQAFCSVFLLLFLFSACYFILFLSYQPFDSVFQTADKGQKKKKENKKKKEGRKKKRKKDDRIRMGNISASQVVKVSIVFGNFLIHSHRSISVLCQDANTFLTGS